jgi:ABC-type uncharacterized transport system permease subunit
MNILVIKKCSELRWWLHVPPVLLLKTLRFAPEVYLCVSYNSQNEEFSLNNINQLLS